jgi:4-carboxymuconolactone decarboxylase
MNTVTRALVEVAVAVGADDREELERALRVASEVAEASQVEEVLLQSYLFVGYPRVLEALKVWRRIWPEPVSDAPADDEETWFDRGAAVLAQVYGAQYARLLDNVRMLHPDLSRWMRVEGYGKVLGREGLDLQVRELCIVALLATQNAEPQLYSHLRGALNVGAEESDVEETLMLALSRASSERNVRAREAWDTVRSRRGGL